MKLKIQPAPVPPEKQKISFQLPKPTLAIFGEYLAAYAEIYGSKADPDFIANEIFVNFFNSDKEFLLFSRNSSAKSSGGKSQEAKQQKQQPADDAKKRTGEASPLLQPTG